MSAVDTRLYGVGAHFANTLGIAGLILRVLMIGLPASLLFFGPVPFPVVAVAIAIDIVVFIVQIVRFANASNIYVQETGKFLPVIGGWSGFLLGGMIMSMLWWFVFAASDTSFNWKSPKDRRAEVEGTAPPKRFRTRLSVDGRILTFDGVISDGTLHKLDPIFRSADRLQQVTLNSPGGNLYEARDLALRVSQYGLNTHVAVECSASCLLAYAAGKERTLGPGAQLGFHRYGLDFDQLHEISNQKAEMHKDRGFFESQAIDPNFLERYFATERKTLWYPHRSLLLDAGVVTKK